MTADLTTRLVCSGCGAVPRPDEPYPFRCPDAADGDDIDHVLRREMSCDAAQTHAWRRVFLNGEPNPFVRYRTLFHSHRIATSRGMSDAEFTGMVESLDADVAAVGGTGFRETPFARHDALNAALGRGAGSRWIKDETGNVSGSHKARHMMGLAIWLEMARRTGMIPADAASPGLAIASCGNAALAAAVVAKAAHRHLDVFIPTDAHPNVTRQLEELGAQLTICEREDATPGDPCVIGFRRGLTRGALPFSVQGNENGLAIEGGLTLGYEIVSSLLRNGASIDRLFVQVGGGALASSCVQALHDAANLGLIARMPRIHAVQTEGAYPLRLAWERVVAQILGERISFRIDKRDSTADAARAAAAVSPAVQAKRRDAVRFAATHRSRFMSPWQSVPHSVAHGILDDETYDWLAIVEAMLDTGGWPLVVSEDELREANGLAAASTAIPADHTGTAGLAGLLRLGRDGAVGPHESLAALFTGIRR
ncbi:MAG: pyridoxal-phosphate dependent enzyme [Thermoanaerobaculia bacterium]|nr:pyridoxal-phosphate dependent enzyme [Thermoanaerobaculia bacterium]